MADVRVQEPHNTTEDDAISRVADLEDMMGRYGVKSIWKGSKAELKGTGVKGSIAVDETNVTVELSLGLIAKAAGIDSKRLEASIRKRLTGAFGG
jgi:putative polyhydroxyalkanoate system protein